MNALQLLDPKGAAKEKAKQKPKARGGIPIHGPQQTRKTSGPPVESSSSPLKYDPTALLNPQAAAKKSKPTSSTVQDGHTENTIRPNQVKSTESAERPGQGAFLERQFGISKREAPPATKHKMEYAENENGEAPQKKMKTTMDIHSSGILGQHLKDERVKGAAQPGQPIAIDLTNEDDNDDEVVITGESSAADNEEVCLGRLHSSAMAWQIPPIPKYQANKVGKDFWPSIRVAYRRSPAANSIIDLIVKTPNNEKGIGIRFGKMEGKLASVLCPLLDGISVSRLRLKVDVEPFPKKAGEFPGHKVSRSLKINVTLYSPRKKADMIGRRLSQSGYFLQPPLRVDPGILYENPNEPKNFGPTKPVGPKAQSSNSGYIVQRTQEEIVRETTSMFDNLAKTENLPEKDANSFITTPLMSHQKQALYFLTQHEQDEQPTTQADQGGSEIEASENKAAFSLWKPTNTKKGETWYNVITGHEVPKKPEPVRGGILADVMGLGKTLSILSLITETLPEARAFGELESPIELSEVKRNAKATLIICPKSVMTNWTEQIKAHTKDKRLRVYTYHGSDRIQDVEELAKCNIVLTPYGTAGAEFSDTLGKRCALRSINWFRIVLDEAHQIRTPTTHISKACCQLSAQRRWAVTGTPVQNKLEDLGALIKFLRIKPFDESSNWSQYITAPFRTADPNVLTNLRLLVDSITLRRMKDKVDLKDRKERVVRLPFSDEELVTYSQFARSSNMQLRMMLGDGGRLKGKSYAHVLKSLGRLRMVCAHGREMLGEEDLKELEGLTAGTAIDLGDGPGDEPDETWITDKHAYETFDMMRDSDLNQCTSCVCKIGAREDGGDADVAELNGESSGDSAEPSEAEEQDDTLGYLTPCFHLLCSDCKDTFIDATKSRLTADHYLVCPYCDQYVRWGLFELTQQGLKNMLEMRKKKKGAKWDETTYSGPHTKVKALLQDLQKSAEETAQLDSKEPPIRSVVFSGWTTYLDLIEYALDEHQIGYVRLDGSMSVKARSAVLQQFATDDCITVLLVSIKAGGQGLNFTAANKVYMMEPQFNPGVEVQAIDRVHRLGQKRDVDIVHYIMQDSVEEKILKLQDKKKKLAEMSMERKMSKSEEAKRRIEELRDLFK